MSRIGKLPVPIPAGVTVTLHDHALTVKGGKGDLTRALHPELTVRVDNEAVRIARPSESKRHKSLHGLTRTLVANMVEGVSKGYEKQLELVGVGYRAAKQGQDLVLTVGYSHPVRYPVPAGIAVEVPEPSRVILRGANKEELGQVAAEIRSVRLPEPYKGKGILYRGERIRRKAGKTGKTGAAPGATPAK